LNFLLFGKFGYFTFVHNDELVAHPNPIYFLLQFFGHPLGETCSVLLVCISQLLISFAIPHIAAPYVSDLKD